MHCSALSYAKVAWHRDYQRNFKPTFIWFYDGLKTVYLVFHFRYKRRYSALKVYAGL